MDAHTLGSSLDVAFICSSISNHRSVAAIQGLTWKPSLVAKIKLVLVEDQQTSWTGITENAERRIRHYCTPLQIVHRKPMVEKVY